MTSPNSLSLEHCFIEQNKRKENAHYIWIQGKGQMWWYTSLIPVPGEAEADGFLGVLGQPGLYRESQPIWGNRVRLCQKKKKKKRKHLWKTRTNETRFYYICFEVHKRLTSSERMLLKWSEYIWCYPQHNVRCLTPPQTSRVLELGGELWQGRWEHSGNKQ